MIVVKYICIIYGSYKGHGNCRVIPKSSELSVGENTEVKYPLFRFRVSLIPARLAIRVSITTSVSSVHRLVVRTDSAVTRLPWTNLLSRISKRGLLYL